MTFWLDAQLDPDLAAWLGSRFGVVAKHLREIGLLKAADLEIYEAARRFSEIVIMTKDQDFLDLNSRLGPPPRVLLLRCENMPTIALQVLLGSTFAAALRDLEQGAALVEIRQP